MTKEKVQEMLTEYKGYIPRGKVTRFKSALAKADEGACETIRECRLYKPLTVFLLSVFLGWAGIDRFYIGDIRIGILKLFLGLPTMFIWPIIDILYCNKRAKEKNLDKLINCL